MNGTLAQAIAIVTHGNLISENEHVGFIGVQKNNTTFQYVRKLSFSKECTESKVFFWNKCKTWNSLENWFKMLRMNNQPRFFLAGLKHTDKLPAHIAGAFANGATNYGIYIDNSAFDGIWIPLWQSTRKHLRGSAVWNVTYHWCPPSKDMYFGMSLDDAFNNLKESLNDIIEFCDEVKDTHWKEIFVSSLSQLSSKSPMPRDYPDIIPQEHYQLDIRQLMAASANSMAVFGGMGSWNDCIFEDKDINDRYHAVSKTLYESIMTGFISATNAINHLN